jgi:hypothetical protein
MAQIISCSRSTVQFQFLMSGHSRLINLRINDPDLIRSAIEGLYSLQDGWPIFNHSYMWIIDASIADTPSMGVVFR